MISRSSHRRFLSVLSLAFALAPAGCIGQALDEGEQADEQTSDASQRLQEWDWTEYSCSYDGDFSGDDYPTWDTYEYWDYTNIASPVQEDMAMEPMQVVIIVGERLDKDPAIEALNLSAEMTAIAYDLLDNHPDIVFTSGRRDVSDQARAMAANVVKNKQWIAQTYSNTPLRTALQNWVNAHPGATKAQIEAGLNSVFAAASPADVASFSKHLSGDAFDVQPVDGAVGNAIYDDLSKLPGRFIDNEGGLRRWHYQHQR